MTDKELLELAAKAAGLEIDKSRQYERYSLVGKETAGLWIENGKSWWNPLIDDGDALRLAVALSLDICRPVVNSANVCVWVDHIGDFIEEPLGTNPYSATCRAIVRAAAEVGKAMK